MTNSKRRYSYYWSKLLYSQKMFTKLIENILDTFRSLQESSVCVALWKDGGTDIFINFPSDANFSGIYSNIAHILKAWNYRAFRRGIFMNASTIVLYCLVSYTQKTVLNIFIVRVVWQSHFHVGTVIKYNA